MLEPYFPKRIKIFPPRRSTLRLANAKEPIRFVTTQQLAVLDPAGARTKLFAKDNPEAAGVGDILLVRQRSGEPFAGVCISIRRNGIDTAILLRNQLLRSAVEMWFKLYSPNVEAVEIVQKPVKRPRRAKLFYMRQAKHDPGSVQTIVQQYLKRKALLGSTEGPMLSAGRGAGMAPVTAGAKRKGAT
ncbi:MAG: hypothetical protein M1826_002421 [Phylliscum demangeonii]|nr:MAG: hypothetical protein M1826_002421 [Phylliscum demangeonii]